MDSLKFVDDLPHLGEDVRHEEAGYLMTTTGFARKRIFAIY
jgi:hypothetical protein